MNNKTLYGIGILVALIVIGYIAWAATSNRQQVGDVEESVTYECSDGRELEAEFGDQMVTVTINNGNDYTLEQIATPAGELYANEGREIVFFRDTEGAFLEENGDVTHENCVESENTGGGDDISDAREHFIDEMHDRTIERVGQPIEGFEPFMFMEAFPGLVAGDFEGVEAELGIYHATSGKVTYEETETQIHSAARAITDIGMETLLANVSKRLNKSAESVDEVDEILSGLEASS